MRIVKVLCLILWIGLFCLLVWPVKKLGRLQLRDRLVRLCYAGIVRIVGIRLKVNGELLSLRPLLLVTNHISYLDIAILGSQYAVRFTPKTEIAGWPVIGWICRLCGAVFVDRRPEKLPEVKQAMESVLADNAVVCLFPEATTGNGVHLQAFKSGLFSLAATSIEGRELIVQPAAIIYTRIRRLPIDTVQWPRIAWYGDMGLVSHLWEFLKLGPVNAELTFLTPLTLRQCGGRKQLAAHCRQSIIQAIADSKQKRPLPSHIRRLSRAAPKSKS